MVEVYHTHPVLRTFVELLNQTKSNQLEHLNAGLAPFVYTLCVAYVVSGCLRYAFGVLYSFFLDSYLVWYGMVWYGIQFARKHIIIIQTICKYSELGSRRTLTAA